MNQTSILQEFSNLIAIPSVSGDAHRAQDIQRTADLLKSKLKSLGFETKLLKQKDHSPFLVASKIVNKHAPTIGIYGHYDVQPEDPVDEWLSPPFELKKRNGKFFGRGTADNKGHIIENVAAVEQLIHENSLTNNIVFLIEGEEESGSSESLETYIEQAKDIIQDIVFFMITDTGMHAKNVPQIFYGLRGLAYFQIDITTGTHDLHSGVYGNTVLNPIQVLANLFASMKDAKTGRVTLPGFYDDVRVFSKDELQVLQKVERTEQEELDESNVFALAPVKGFHPSLAPKILPSFDLHGIVGGYTGEGAKTIIPYSASAKFSFRLIEHQDPKKIEKLVKMYIADHLPKSVHYTLKNHENCPAFYTEFTNPYTQQVAKILEKTFEHETLFNRSGGSIPIAEILQRLYKKPVVLTGFTLPDENLHAPNENFDEDMFWKGIEALQRIYSADWKKI